MNSYLRIKKSLKAFYKFILVFVFTSVLFNSCAPTFSYRPTGTLCSFPMVNIFLSCHNPITSSKTLAYKVTLTTYYYNNGTKNQMDQVYYTSDQVNPSANVTLQANIPASSTGVNWAYDIYIVGTQCSTCAVTQWLNNYSCIQTQIGNAISAGVPSLYGGHNEIVGYSSSVPTINFAGTYYTWANTSCGCTVPYN